ncbi:hypothetical protein LY76DRAFT_596341 [Colletotrichum caudatum]|nr:hypothetical protein LY76DRAFT_596341 [Colletotrichum caudatum]
MTAMDVKGIWKRVRHSERQIIRTLHGRFAHCSFAFWPSFRQLTVAVFLSAAGPLVQPESELQSTITLSYHQHLLGKHGCEE